MKKYLAAVPQSMLLLLNQVRIPALLDRFAGDFEAAKKRFLFFDYDGTLSAIKPGSVNAEDPTAELKLRLEKLVAVPNTTVYIVSARPLPKLMEWFSGISGMGLAGDLGTVIRHPHQTAVNALLPEVVLAKWNSHLPAVERDFKLLLQAFPGAWISQGQFSIALKPPILPYNASDWESRVTALYSKLKTFLPASDFRVALYQQKELVIEPLASEKQLAVNHVLSQVKPGVLKDSLLLFAGDGDSDESGFSAIRRQDAGFTYPIRVGSERQSPNIPYMVDSPATLLSFIDRITDIGPK